MQTFKVYYYVLSKQNVSRMSTDWQQIWSENVNKLISTTFRFRFVDKICSHNKTAEIEQNLMTHRR